jgi:hypothetical protein
MAQEAFPFHFLVWNNQYLELERQLQKNEVGQPGVATYVSLFSTVHVLSLTALRPIPHRSEGAPQLS